MTEPPEDPEGAEETLTARDATRGMGPALRINTLDNVSEEQREAYFWAGFADALGEHVADGLERTPVVSRPAQDGTYSRILEFANATMDERPYRLTVTVTVDPLPRDGDHG